MVGSLLLRGMLVGILAGIMSFAFLRTFGEPQVDRAIAFETQMDEAKARNAAATGMAMAADAPATEAVSRKTQAGLGLLTAVIVYGAAFGGLFALIFAFVYGRFDAGGARGLAALLALAAFIAVNAAPALKYPANPPSVGEPETIGMRTALYFIMMALSIVAMIGAVALRGLILRRYGAWNASLAAGAAYLAVIVGCGIVLPAVNEVPEHFPAVVLWQFRIASIGAQSIMWATIGLAFGALTERAAKSA